MMVKREIMVVFQIQVAVTATATHPNLIAHIQTPRRMKEVINGVTPPMTTTVTVVGILVILLLNVLQTCHLKSRNGALVILEKMSSPCMFDKSPPRSHSPCTHSSPSHHVTFHANSHSTSPIMTHHRFTVDSNDEEAYLG